MYAKQQLSHREVNKIVSTIQDQLEQGNKSAAIAVVDAHGELLAFLRTDGCPFSSINIAINKAFTAARERIKTSELEKRSREENFPMTNFGDLRYISFGGGVPINHEGVTIGAVAVSGLTSEEDEQLAEIGIAVIL